LPRFADDQLGLMDHFGTRQFQFIGNCISGCFARKLMERTPDRVVGAVFWQTFGHRTDLAAEWILSGATLAIGVVIMRFVPARRSQARSA
jgi:pimeloyl-ACP methyl ester carboxylesterase